MHDRGMTSAPPLPSRRAEVDKSGERVRAMFAAIAPHYDRLNRLFSMNIDRLWRKRTVASLPLRPGAPILDVCTGTAELALALDRRMRGAAPVVGVDFTPELLRRGAAKAGRAGRPIRLVQGDALRIPFPDDTFQAVTVAFGLRNVSDTAGGLDELIRVAEPGGTVAILEFSRPRGPVLGPLYMAFFRRILPRVGQFLAPNDHSAYDYLPESVLQFPDGRAMLDLMASRGLADPRQRILTGGIASLYTGTKPAREGSP